MLELLGLSLSVFLSLAIFNFLFYWLNCSKLKSFKTIQNKIDTFNEKKKRRIKAIIFILITTIFPLILLMLNMSIITIGFIMGILASVRDICFRDTFIEIFKNEQSL